MVLGLHEPGGQVGSGDELTDLALHRRRDLRRSARGEQFVADLAHRRRGRVLTEWSGRCRGGVGPGAILGGSGR